MNLPCSLMANSSQAPVLGSPRQMATSQAYSLASPGVNVNVCSLTQAMLYKGARIPTLTAKYSSSSSVPGQSQVRVAVQRAISTPVSTGAGYTDGVGVAVGVFVGIGVGGGGVGVCVGAGVSVAGRVRLSVGVGLMEGEVGLFVGTGRTVVDWRERAPGTVPAHAQERATHRQRVT
jgi:hypothetical protein